MKKMKDCSQSSNLGAEGLEGSGEVDRVKGSLLGDVGLKRSALEGLVRERTRCPDVGRELVDVEMRGAPTTDTGRADGREGEGGSLADREDVEEEVEEEDDDDGEEDEGVGIMLKVQEPATSVAVRGPPCCLMILMDSNLPNLRTNSSKVM